MMPTTDVDRPKVSTMVKRAEDDALDPTEPAVVIDTDSIGDLGDVEEQIRSYLGTEHRRVVTAVSLWTGSLDDATDAVTDALGRAWERMDRGEAIDNLAAWVTHAAMNQIRSTHRRTKVATRKRHLVVMTETTEDETATWDSHLDLRRALEQLTRRQRAVVALYYGLDLPVEQIAQTIGVASGTVKATLHQARTRLEHLLTNSSAGDTDD